jgi:amidase/aspartyl-tRNA(Asn)/glutamyl-tRNA(Gln) amidotransferase subunit A
LHTPDLHTLRKQLDEGSTDALTLLDQALAAARSPRCAHAFVSIDEQGARTAAAAPAGALAGLPISVKDLYDIAGQVTSAGSVVLADQPPAPVDAPAVARLRAAGAALIGRTQMTEFAFSGVGINPHHGTPANVAMAALDPAAPACVPGGSSSGGAVSVAAGAAVAALGSDTGGSIRIPAALHGLVGFKNTQALTPASGTVPLAPSLDTVCAITRSVRDAVLLHEILAERVVRLDAVPLAARRLAVVRTLMLDALEAPVAAAFERALETIAQAGAQIEFIDLPLLDELPRLTQDGGLPAAESWAWHRELLARDGARYDPRVAARIRRGAAITPAALAALHAARADWIGRMSAALAGFDAVLSPTVPMIPPPLAPLLADDAAFFEVNARLLRNPSVVNLLDGCAISLPCHAPGTAPVGLMAWSLGGRDDRLLSLALQLEAALKPARESAR